MTTRQRPPHPPTGHGSWPGNGLGDGGGSAGGGGQGHDSGDSGQRGGAVRHGTPSDGSGRSPARDPQGPGSWSAGGPGAGGGRGGNSGWYRDGGGGWNDDSGDGDHSHEHGREHEHGQSREHGHAPEHRPAGGSSGKGPSGDGTGGNEGGGGGGGHGHAHSHGPAAPVSQHLRKVIAAILIPFTAAVIVGLVVLWPGGAPSHERTGVGFDRQTQQATVTRVVEVSCKSVNASGSGGSTGAAAGTTTSDDDGGTCKKATVRVDTGKNKGRTFTEVVQPDQSRQLHQDEKVVVAYEPSAPKNLQFSVTDVNRRIPMTVLAGIFALVVVAVGRLRGLMALIALAVSFMVLTFFILPGILQGSNPLLVAVVGSSAIMLIALYMCHGLSARTSVAVLGTLVSLLLIGLLGSLFIDWASLTGNTDDNTGLIHGLYPSIDMSGLLLAGVIIGSLGVLDDVTVTQTSAVWELHEANPTMGWRGLYRAGIRIGRDHIASVVNTLVLAYAGAALPLLLLFSIAQSSVGTVANSELVAEEIVRTLVGSIGLVAAVPVTTALAALVVSADRPAPPKLPAPTRTAPVGPAPVDTSASPRGGRGRRRKR